MLNSLELSGVLVGVVEVRVGIEGVDNRRVIRLELVGLSRGAKVLTLLELIIEEDCLRAVEIEFEAAVGAIVLVACDPAWDSLCLVSSFSSSIDREEDDGASAGFSRRELSLFCAAFVDENLIIESRLE